MIYQLYKILSLLIFTSVTLLSFADTFSDNKPVVSSMINSQNVAIHGYDTVAYFTQDSAIKGQSQYSATYLNHVWWFASKENLTLFENNPEQYAPQYNGHCANGLSDGHQVNGDPEIYRIIDGKLYFFFSKWGRLQWRINQQEQIQLANDFWQKNNP